MARELATAEAAAREAAVAAAREAAVGAGQNGCFLFIAVAPQICQHAASC